jgi:hypothetical protein
MRHPFDAEFYPDQPDDIQAIVISPPAYNIGVPRGTPTSKTADYFVLKINNEWRNTVSCILNVAAYCAEALATLDGGERRKFYDGLPFDRSACQKLASIAANAALYNPVVQQHLPAHWTIIHKLAHCSPQEILRAIQEGVLHPKCCRNRLEAWVRTNTATGVEAAQRAALRASRRVANETARYATAHVALVEAFKSSPLMKQWLQSPKAVRDMFIQTIKEIR